MYKNRNLLLAGAIALTAVILASCGGSNGKSSVVNKAVKAAEETIVSEASPALGMLPSLQAQYKEANSQLRAHFEEAGKKIEAKFKDGGSMEDAFRESAKLEDERKAASEELRQLYKEKVMTEVAVVAEKPLKVTFDESQYSAAVAKVVARPDSSITSPIMIEVELTLSDKPYMRSRYSTTVNCRWEYQDADNNKIGEGALPISDSYNLKTGDKIIKEIIPSLSQEQAMKLDHLYFKKDN